jgi:hypothetical protein
MITALAERRIDALDAEVKRFPLEMKEIVYVRIQIFFHKYNVKVLVSWAAYSMDLLAQKAALELEIERHSPFRARKISAYIRH